MRKLQPMMIAPPQILAIDGEVIISTNQFPSLSPNAARQMAERLLAVANAADVQSRLIRGF